VTQPKVLLIIPTLGIRIDHLRACLASIRSQPESSEIVIVAPITPETQSLATEFAAHLLADPGSQSSAINVGVSFGLSLNSYEYVNWLCDDDLLEPHSLTATVNALRSNPNATVAYGACRYIDEQGQQLWISKAGKWATKVLGWGPDLIPQPGMLVRMDAWQAVGGVDESYRFAFDLDLLLKLKKIGPLVDTGVVVSSFRWHADSLTVSDRTTNLEESERAKRAALSPTARKLAWLWEKPVRVATRAAAAEVNRRARKLAS
jgi:GT2 family glycosyltransferase